MTHFASPGVLWTPLTGVVVNEKICTVDLRNVLGVALVVPCEQKCLYIAGDESSFGQGSFRGVTRGNAVPLLNSCRNAWKQRSHCQSVLEHIIDGIANHFRLKMHWTAGLCIQSQMFFFAGGHIPGPRRSAPVARTATSISAWLAGVPIVPVLRNDHWLRWRSGCGRQFEMGSAKGGHTVPLSNLACRPRASILCRCRRCLWRRRRLSRPPLPAYLIAPRIKLRFIREWNAKTVRQNVRRRFTCIARLVMDNVRSYTACGI